MSGAALLIAAEVFRFGRPLWLLGLWLAPVLVAVLMAAAAVRRAALRRFAEPRLLAQLNRGASPGRRIAKGALCVSALALAAVALARPQWDPQPVEVRAEGRDVCFIVDVSRSMLAQDGPDGAIDRPSRLERAKIWMGDVADSLAGDRVALVAFAGTSVVKCPLTQDYGFFRLVVDDLSPDSVSRGGTMIGDAVRLAIDEVFDLAGAVPDGGDFAGFERRYRDIILITDGEDQGSLPVAAAERAGGLGIRIIALGIGSEEGERIPYVDERGRERYVTDASGRTVVTRLDVETLKRMALATPSGSFLNVGDGTIELDRVYRQLVQAAEHNMETRGETFRYQEGFQYFLAAALVLLMVESLIGERRSGVQG